MARAAAGVCAVSRFSVHKRQLHALRDEQVRDPDRGKREAQERIRRGVLREISLHHLVNGNIQYEVQHQEGHRRAREDFLLFVKEEIQDHKSSEQNGARNRLEEEHAAESRMTGEKSLALRAKEQQKNSTQSEEESKGSESKTDCQHNQPSPNALEVVLLDP